MDRLEDKGGNVATAQRAFERDEVVERDRFAVGEKRLEPLPEYLVAAQGERAVGKSMECMMAGDDLRAAGCHARELDCGFDRFRPGIAEKHLAGPRHAPNEALGEKTCQQRDVELDKAGEPGVKHLP